MRSETQSPDARESSGGATRCTWGFQQEAYDVERAAIARALETAARRPYVPARHVTIIADAQAAILRMASDEPGSGRIYPLEVRKHIANLRQWEPTITVELRWCPAHKGCQGTSRPMSGPRWRRASQMPVVWNSSDTATGMGDDTFPPGHWRT